MITIIICVVIGIIIGIVDAYKDDMQEIMFYIPNSLLGIIIGGVIGTLIAFCLPMHTYDKVFQNNIEALQDGNSIHGSFFLGCGSVNGEMKYFLYINDNGTYQLKEFPSCKVKIRYSEGSPRIITHEVEITKDLMNYFALDDDIGEQTYIIEVPKGTIKNNFTLDAQ